MMDSSKFAKIRKVTRNKRGAGGVLTAEQIKEGLNGQLAELSSIIKEFIIAEAQKGGRNNFRKDGKSGFIQSTQVEFTTDGVKIDLPEQAQYLENGRKPFTKKVPIQALIAWLKRYRILGRAKSGKYQKASQGSITSTAWAIQQSIYKNGIKARPFIKASLDFAEDVVAQVIDEVMIPEIVSVIDFHFENKK